MNLPPEASALKSMWAARDHLPADSALWVLKGLDPQAHWVARLHAARLAPFVVWDDPKPVIDRLFELAAGENRFVMAWALDALSRFALDDRGLADRVVPVLLDAFAQSTGAVRVRAREALDRLK